MGQRGDFRRLAAAVRLGLLAAACLALTNCSSHVDPHFGVSASPRVVGPGEPVPKGGGVYRVGKPYRVAGRLYVPEADPDYSEVGLASWYGDDFRGRLTANGEVFDNASLSAASPVLPMPCYARVTNLRNGRSIIVRVNDRGPYAANRIIDVSEQTAKVARLLRPWFGKGSGRLCRAGSAGRLRRPHADGDACARTGRRRPPRGSGLPRRAPSRRCSGGSSGNMTRRRLRGSGRLPPPRRGHRKAANWRHEARIEQTFGPAPGPAMASIADPSAAPSAGAAGATPELSAYASPGRSSGAAFMSGRGIY